jgi:hypothetical protein
MISKISDSPYKMIRCLAVIYRNGDNNTIRLPTAISTTINVKMPAPVPVNKMSKNNDINNRTILTLLDSSLPDTIFLAHSGLPSHLFFLERLYNSKKARKIKAITVLYIIAAVIKKGRIR